MKYNIRLDLCTICNLNCKACYMRLKKDNQKNIGIGYLKFNTFKKFIDENKEYIDTMEISNNGEALINPDIIPILKYSYENGIKVKCENGTNLSFKNDDLLKALVDYEVLGITVSCDGVTQETYAQYRVNGNVNLVLDNIKKIQEYKKLKNSNYPHIFWQYIIRKSTEDEAELAVQKAKELGVDLIFKLTWEGDYEPSPEKVDRLMQITGLKTLTRKKYEQQTGKKYSPSGIPTCSQFWNQIAINWDGKWLICCANRTPVDVNIFDIGIKAFTEMPIYKETGDWLLGDIDVISDNTPCYLCKKGAKFRQFCKENPQMKKQILENH